MLFQPESPDGSIGLKRGPNAFRATKLTFLEIRKDRVRVSACHKPGLEGIKQTVLPTLELKKRTRQDVKGSPEALN